MWLPVTILCLALLLGGARAEAEPAKLRVSGLVAVDAAAISGGDPPLANDADLRFLDVIASMEALDGKVTGAFVYDFANHVRPIEDAWLIYRPTPKFSVTIGNHKQPFSLQALNGSPERVLAEAAIPQALAPDRAVGVSAGLVTDHWTLTAGAYMGNVNDRVSRGSSWGARATIAPIRTKDVLLHVGLSVNRTNPPGDVISFAAYPATLRSGRPLVATGLLAGTRSVDRLGAELALRRGPVLFQAEYTLARLDRAGAEATLDGGYATVSWTITGEARPYLSTANPNQRGTFGALHPLRPLGAGGIGAIELVARYSRTDLRITTAPGSGDVDGAALAANWFPTANLRFTLEGVWTISHEVLRDERASLALLRAAVLF